MACIFQFEIEKKVIFGEKCNYETNRSGIAIQFYSRAKLEIKGSIKVGQKNFEFFFAFIKISFVKQKNVLFFEKSFLMSNMEH